MDKKKATEIREKIIRGLDLAFERLINEKIKVDGELIFSIDGEIVRVKVCELKNNKKLAQAVIRHRGLSWR